MLISLVSIKGSPGVTTTAAALASVGAEHRAKQGWEQGIDLVELDPGGGDIEALTGVTGEPGLLRAATDLRLDWLPSYAVDAPAGARSLLAPMSPMEAVSTVMAAVADWGSALSAMGGVVVADAGRWERAHPASARLAGSDIVVLVLRPDARSVEHARHAVPDLRMAARSASIVLAAVGDRPYRCNEVAAVVGLDPAGTMVWDPTGAAALWGSGISRNRFRRWSASPLARSARALLTTLVQPLDRLVDR